MSKFSGRCDLFDHMSGLGGWYDRNGKPVKIGDPGVGVYYSDEYQDFLAFKKRTGGVIHQHKKVKVTEWNQKEVEKNIPNMFKVIEHKEEIKDKRYKDGIKEVISYTYEYWGKEYKTLKELNKHGVYITIDIHFDTILDLIPYYPYIVSSCCSSGDKETVFISKESFVISERDEHCERGYFSDSWEWYNKKLQDHYREIVLEYFNPTGREHIEEVTFDENGIGKVSEPIDENFYVEWRWEDGKPHDHWTSPEVLDAQNGKIKMHKYDIKLLSNKMLVYYVGVKDKKLNLG